jgi:heme/copper-type cytochrome/quinol oxidase subunit 2|tara:strand:+ start:112 stop:723 length:612 start_codon:yes stop_codon:yes gene_type:complete
VATFTTVAFLGYLYDLLVRRREAAHPIRETRGFSRAQTGDLITAVLPLTWSATMVMHASTHSINFDENTAGAAFSFTVIAYQWGWNYYFPRDVVSQMEAAPRIVGRGRVVSFAPTPLETAEARSEDLWAMRATLGSRHASRTGRLNASAALALTLPTDVPAGALASLPRGAAWRRVAAESLGESVPTSGVNASEGGSRRVAPV